MRQYYVFAAALVVGLAGLGSWVTAQQGSPPPAARMESNPAVAPAKPAEAPPAPGKPAPVSPTAAAAPAPAPLAGPLMPPPSPAPETKPGEPMLPPPAPALAPAAGAAQAPATPPPAPPVTRPEPPKEAAPAPAGSPQPIAETPPAAKAAPEVALPPAPPPPPNTLPAVEAAPPRTVSAAAPAPLPAGTPPVEPATPAPAPVPRPAVAATGAQTPTVYLEKVGPPYVSVGKPLTYQIIARNTGTVPVFNVRVEEELPAGARFQSAEPKPEVRGNQLAWGLGSLDAGAERRIQVEIQPAGEGEFASNATVTFSASSGLKTQVTRPKLTLTLAGPEAAQVGEPAVFQVHIANEGTGPAAGVVAHVNLPGGLWHDHGSRLDADLGTLPAGATKTVSLQTTAVRAGRQVNEAVVTCEDGLKVTAQATVLVTEAVLSLRQAGPHRRYLNREASFDLELANTGTAPAANVRLADVLPEGLEFRSAEGGGVYDQATRTVSWMIPTLPPGQKQNLTVKATARSPGDLVCRAAAQADRGLEVKADLAVHVEGIPALTLEVVDVEDPVEVGAEAVYEVRVFNQGTAPSTGVQLTATVPAGMVAKGAGGPTQFRVQGQQIIFEPVPRLAPRADLLYRVQAVGQQPGDMRFKVQLISDQLSTPINEEESTRVYSDQDEVGLGAPAAAWKPVPGKTDQEKK